MAYDKWGNGKSKQEESEKWIKKNVYKSKKLDGKSVPIGLSVCPSLIYI